MEEWTESPALRIHMEAVAACMEVPATGPVYTGLTDADGGAYADSAGYGRGSAAAYTGRSDSDGGAYADAAGYGRSGSYTGRTDSDGGAYADAAGYGRR